MRKNSWRKNCWGAIILISVAIILVDLIANTDWTELSAHHVTVKQLAEKGDNFSDGLIVMVKGWAEPTSNVLDMYKHKKGELAYNFYGSKLHDPGSPFVKTFAEKSIYTRKGCEILARWHRDAGGNWLEVLKFWGDGQTWKASDNS
ncbi:MAG: hypothetical protein UX02_C0002G0047 [Candidatus Moranbacteria bacterium GW2011_GWC1_45_18]|nr:MAG: hypothetical protein UT79_C0001G0414 [Candidatus Moranbacteria bacterium GW2011_GWC2_40_12]KKT32439.1 MAG: hypothetical protein UW19_C0021G0006 [Candidatus Moranbacteria bacterium GW2011_GWF2_44_10]KKT71472.1 MAG: hypothetical protein UW66_C0031G0003 [Candidatus Moranbacteria bacterium GW2011_GWF1_44_4]KKT99728.1 MAG: hypothetical protein UX02_C0002G0047 [Candidatus Moranbacteria bacterium GW2011_GWC1_45_18]OGI24339.1 MAG: hypothetical protein A2194_04295 [Candidatus Moranbacteria bacte